MAREDEGGLSDGRMRTSCGSLALFFLLSLLTSKGEQSPILKLLDGTRSRTRKVSSNPASLRCPRWPDIDIGVDLFFFFQSSSLSLKDP